MPRDGAETRQRLIAAGRLLFARRGVYATPLKAIVDAAGQRNTSALHYHFGSRQGLLEAIIAETNDGIENRRQTMLDGTLDGPLGIIAGQTPAQFSDRNDAPRTSLAQLVNAWIEPQAVLLHDTLGRQFLSIVSQLNDLFDEWDESSMPPQAWRTMQAIDARLTQVADAAVRKERLNRFLEMTAEALGSRARRIERGSAPTLAHDAWVANLAAMSVGALQA